MRNIGGEDDDDDIKNGKRDFGFTAGKTKPSDLLSPQVGLESCRHKISPASTRQQAH